MTTIFSENYGDYGGHTGILKKPRADTHTQNPTQNRSIYHPCALVKLHNATPRTLCNTENLMLGAHKTSPTIQPIAGRAVGLLLCYNRTTRAELPLPCVLMLYPTPVYSAPQNALQAIFGAFQRKVPTNAQCPPRASPRRAYLRCAASTACR